MITNQKLKKSLEEIKNITSFDAILYSAKGKHLTGTVEEPEHSDIFVKEFIVSEEDVREKNDAVAFAVEIDSELEYVLVMFCQYTSENLVIGRMAVCQLRPPQYLFPFLRSYRFKHCPIFCNRKSIE